MFRLSQILRGLAHIQLSVCHIRIFKMSSADDECLGSLSEMIDHWEWAINNGRILGMLKESEVAEKLLQKEIACPGFSRPKQG